MPPLDTPAAVEAAAAEAAAELAAYRADLREREASGRDAGHARAMVELLRGRLRLLSEREQDQLPPARAG